MKMTDRGAVVLEKVTHSYHSPNRTPVLAGVNLVLERGEMCFVLGEEGAGKTTLLHSIVRNIDAAGRIEVDSLDLTNRRTWDMVSLGIAFVNQGGNIFNDLTVYDHVRLACEASKKRLGDAWPYFSSSFPQVAGLKHLLAGSLSGGERMMLSIGCVLISDAKFMIFDEPSTGLSPAACLELASKFKELQQSGKTLLVMENNFDFSFEVAQTVVLLRGGALSRKYHAEEFKREGFLTRELYERIGQNGGNICEI